MKNSYYILIKFSYEKTSIILFNSTAELELRDPLKRQTDSWDPPNATKRIPFANSRTNAIQFEKTKSKIRSEPFQSIKWPGVAAPIALTAIPAKLIDLYIYRRCESVAKYYSQWNHLYPRSFWIRLMKASAWIESLEWTHSVGVRVSVTRAFKRLRWLDYITL